MKVDGRKIAREIYSELSQKTTEYIKKGITPHLVIILIGNDPASKAYIRQKINRGTEIGIHITYKRYPRHVTQKTLFRYIETLNQDDTVHGIIIQRPVPKQIDAELLKTVVNPEKDVDGFHPERRFEPPLALAIMLILEEVYSKEQKIPRASFISSDPSAPFRQWLTSKNIVFLGRGEAGGKPVISHVEKLSIPHSIVHSKTEKPEEYIKSADIIISAVGKRRVVTSKKLKQGVILVGIGLHKGSDGKLYGDYEEEDIKDVASYYTPTPGGVGPVNVAMLLSNLIKAVSFQLNK